MFIDIFRAEVTVGNMNNKMAAIDDVSKVFDRDYQLKGSDFRSDVRRLRSV